MADSESSEEENGDKLDVIDKISLNFSNVKKKTDQFEYGFEPIMARSKQDKSRFAVSH